MTLQATHLPVPVPPGLPPALQRGQLPIALVPEAERRRAFARARRHSFFVRALKITLPVLAVASVAVLFISPTMVIQAVRPDLKGASIEGVEVTGDQLRMVNPRFEGFTADQGHYVVSAKAAVQSVGNIDQMHLESVHGHLIEVDKSWTDITAKGGIYETKKRTMRLTDGIVITTSAKAKAELDNADIDMDSKKVTSAVPVVMTLPNGTLKGRGLLIEGDAKRFVLTAEVEAHLIPPKAAMTKKTSISASPLAATPAMSDGPIDVKAKRLEVLDAAKTANFLGAVEAKQAGMTLTAEQLEVGYASQPGANPLATTAVGTAQDLRSVTALRNVIITTADGRKATCDKSQFEPAANRMKLSGSVVLSQGASVLHADLVVADLTTHRTLVTAASRVSGHFLPPAKPGPGQPAGGLAGLGASGSATDISAQSLELADDTGEAVFQGTVMVSQRGNRLNGERLAIDMTHRRMTMSGPGRVSGRFEATAAPGKEATPAPDESIQTVSSGVSVGRSFTGLSAGNGQPTNIEADSLTVEDERGEAIFTGKVVVLRGNNRISAGQMHVFYSGGGANAQDSAQLSRITAKDHVVINAPDNQVATGDWLLYEAAKNQLVMGGNVTVSQAGNVVHGDKLVVDLDTGESHFDTRSAAGADQSSDAAPRSGRIQVLITPQGAQQFGATLGASSAKGASKTKPRPKSAMSASDVLVAPDVGQQ